MSRYKMAILSWPQVSVLKMTYPKHCLIVVMTGCVRSLCALMAWCSLLWYDLQHEVWYPIINSLTLGNVVAILKILQIKIMSSCEIALIWMLQNAFDDESTLVQVMAWCHQAPSHYLNHVDPLLVRYMTSLGHYELKVRWVIFYLWNTDE